MGRTHTIQGQRFVLCHVEVRHVSEENSYLLFATRIDLNISLFERLRWKPSHLLTVDLLVQRPAGRSYLQLLAWSGGESYKSIATISTESVDENR